MALFRYLLTESVVAFVFSLFECLCLPLTFIKVVGCEIEFVVF